MATVVGEATGRGGVKHAMLAEALQNALENAKPPSAGNDVQTFRLSSVELEHGGIVGSTVTRVTLEVRDGPLGSRR